MNVSISTYANNLKSAIDGYLTMSYNQATFITDSESEQTIEEIITEMIKDFKNIVVIYGLSVRAVEPMSCTKETHVYSCRIYPCVRAGSKWDSTLRHIIPFLGTPRSGQPLTKMVSDLINLLHNNSLTNFLDLGGKIINADEEPINIGRGIHIQALIHEGRKYE